MMALPFLPVIAVRPAYTALCNEPLVANNPAIQQFVGYFAPTWLDGQFPVRMWNVYNSNVRTNNQVESWHSRLNRTVGLTHPNVYRLLDSLRREQTLTELTLRQARQGASPPRRRHKYLQLDRRLERLRDAYRQGLTTTAQFLDAVRHIAHHY